MAQLCKTNCYRGHELSDGDGSVYYEPRTLTRRCATCLRERRAALTASFHVKPRRSCPPRDVLARLLEKESWVEIARQYGVSDNGVRKWAKRHGLSKPLGSSARTRLR